MKNGNASSVDKSMVCRPTNKTEGAVAVAVVGLAIDALNEITSDHKSSRAEKVTDQEKELSDRDRDWHWRRRQGWWKWVGGGGVSPLKDAGAHPAGALKNSTGEHWSTVAH